MNVHRQLFPSKFLLQLWKARNVVSLVQFKVVLVFSKFSKLPLVIAWSVVVFGRGTVIRCVSKSSWLITSLSQRISEISQIVALYHWCYCIKLFECKHDIKKHKINFFISLSVGGDVMKLSTNHAHEKTAWLEALQMPGQSPSYGNTLKRPLWHPHLHGWRDFLAHYQRGHILHQSLVHHVVIHLVLLQTQRHPRIHLALLVYTHRYLNFYLK